MDQARLGMLGMMIAVLPSLAGAGTTVIGTAGDFAANTSNEVFGNFADVPTVIPGTNPGTFFSSFNPLSGYADLQGVALLNPGSPGTVNVNSPFYYGSSDLSQPYALAAGSALAALVITLPQFETAFALDFGSLFNSTQATFTLSNGFSTTVTTAVSTAGQTGFIGFVSDTPFNTVTLTVPVAQDWTVLDFIQARANPQAAAVPEPNTALLMCAGTLLLGAIMAWRRQPATTCRKRHGPAALRSR